ATPRALAASTRHESHQGILTPNRRSNERAPGPARASALAIAMFVAGSSAPPWFTQIGLSPCCFRQATIIGAIDTTGPAGLRRPSAVSAPPVSSVAPAITAHLRAGSMPILSKL